MQAEIEALRSELEATSEGAVSYDGADMTKPDEIERMVQGAVARSWCRRYSGQQCRHSNRLTDR